MSGRDRIGLGWREPLAAQMFKHFDDIEVVEVLAEDCLRASARHLRSLRSLGVERPMLLHGVTLGAASTVPVNARRLDRLARLVDELQPAHWSEHLAFVRGGGYEVGHLAAPPRNARTLQGAAENWRKIGRVVGRMPAAENIATLIDPPDSDMSGVEWVSGVVQAAGADLLLDLHNLHANSVNFGLDARDCLAKLPLDRVALVHISGGHWIEACDPSSGATNRRLLDDHVHDVPNVVFQMLEYLGEHCVRHLHVILERDGCYPDFAVLLRQLDLARSAIARGRFVRTRKQKEDCRELAAV